jgi:hypothetical protein
MDTGLRRGDDSKRFSSFGEMAEWVNSDVFLKALKVPSNRVNDGPWMDRLGASHGRIEEQVFKFGEMAEWSKALDWNSSNIFTGVPGFESLSLRQPFNGINGLGTNPAVTQHPA